jgi:hypothetical protein
MTDADEKPAATQFSPLRRIPCTGQPQRRRGGRDREQRGQPGNGATKLSTAPSTKAGVVNDLLSIASCCFSATSIDRYAHPVHPVAGRPVNTVARIVGRGEFMQNTDMIIKIKNLDSLLKFAA